MRGEYIELNRIQFKEFNQDDQFGLIEELFIDSENYDYDFEKEMDKLFDKYDSICVDRNDNICGKKDGKLIIIQKQADEARMIAQEVVEM